jgi:hypothetical protein
VITGQSSLLAFCSHPIKPKSFSIAWFVSLAGSANACTCLQSYVRPGCCTLPNGRVSAYCAASLYCAASSLTVGISPIYFCLFGFTPVPCQLSPLPHQFNENIFFGDDSFSRKFSLYELRGRKSSNKTEPKQAKQARLSV